MLELIDPKTFVNSPALWEEDFPVPDVLGHKYERGHAVVVSGGLSSTGAARLAARGALRAGAGLVTIASPREALAVNAGASLAVMVRPVDGADELTAFLSDKRRNVIVLGPGGGVGPQMRDMVLAALAGERGGGARRRCADELREEPQTLHQGGRPRMTRGRRCLRRMRASSLVCSMP